MLFNITAVEYEPAVLSLFNVTAVEIEPAV